MQQCSEVGRAAGDFVATNVVHSFATQTVLTFFLTCNLFAIRSNDGDPLGIDFRFKQVLKKDVAISMSWPLS